MRYYNLWMSSEAGAVQANQQAQISKGHIARWLVPKMVKNGVKSSFVFSSLI